MIIKEEVNSEHVLFSFVVDKDYWLDQVVESGFWKRGGQDLYLPGESSSLTLRVVSDSMNSEKDGSFIVTEYRTSGLVTDEESKAISLDEIWPHLKKSVQKEILCNLL